MNVFYFEYKSKVKSKVVLIHYVSLFDNLKKKMLNFKIKQYGFYFLI